MIIYKLTSPSGKSYIGQTIKTLAYRMREHGYECKNGTNNKMKNAVRKYGIKSFTKEILCESNSKENLNLLEQFYIAKYDTIKSGYNSNAGGGSNIGYKHTEETKKKMSSQRQGPDNGMYGKKQPFLTARNNSDQNPFLNKNQDGANNHMFGKGGDKHHNAKSYIITDPQGTVYYVKGLSPFCKLNNISAGNMSDVAQGKTKATKGWTCKYDNNH